MAKVNNLESLLASLSEQTAGDDVSVREMLNAVGRRSYGPILLLLGFIAISPLTIIPGTSWLVALVILLIAGQIVLGRAFRPPFVGLSALVCIAAALVTFPLGLIPFGPVLPGLTVLLFGLGLTARDGFVLIAAGAGLAGAIYVLLRVWSALPFG